MTYTLESNPAELESAVRKLLPDGYTCEVIPREGHFLCVVERDGKYYPLSIEWEGEICPEKIVANAVEVLGVPASLKEWCISPSYPDYLVSDHGDVRHRRANAPLLAGDTDPKGYRRVGLNGKHVRVARLVCEAFSGPCPDGFECAHLDGNKHNNSANNLAWVSRSENVKHSIAHGTYARPAPPRGERQAHAKLTEAQVREIRAKAKSGMSRRAIAREYGISTTQAHRIATRENWATV